MNSFSLVVFLVLVVLTLTLPRKLILLPIAIAVLHTPFLESISLGTIRIQFIQLIALATFIRAKISSTSNISLNATDKWLIATCIALVLPAVGRNDVIGTLVFNTKIATTYYFIYFAFRHSIETIDDFQRFSKMIAVISLPLALEMFLEQAAGHNYYSMFDSISASPQIRSGRLRANGPFSHAILAGTVGSICIFICQSISEKKWRNIGTISCISIILSSASSGPIAGLLAGIFAIYMKRHRSIIRYLIYSSPFIYAALYIIMGRNPVYIIAYIDFTGSSTSWYRARLIDSAFQHIGEWWTCGTDYTRHWMATGVTNDPNNTDITSHYIAMGVTAGILPFSAFIGLILSGFRSMKKLLSENDSIQFPREWAIGAALFSLSISITCVALFDNSMVLLFGILGTISSLSQSRSNNAVSILANDIKPINETRH